MPLPIPHLLATKTERAKVLTGTDMRRLARGEWLELWREKVEGASQVDLSRVWKPMLGLHTEPLHARWHAMTTGDELIQMEDRPHYVPGLAHVEPYHAATFDRWVVADDCPLEMKHTNARNCLRDCANDYMPQIQWQMHVSGADRLRFSIICGNEEPDWGYVARDHEYIDRQRRMADVFWKLVIQEIPPDSTGLGGEPDEQLADLAKIIPVNSLRPYDYSLNNEWCDKARRYVEIKPIADECAVLNTAIKELVPADASEVTGAGVRVSRNKKGSLTLTIKGEG